MQCTPKYTTINLTSADRISGTPSNLVLTMSPPLVMDNCEEVSLQSFSWILEANKINSRYNTIPFDEGGVPAFAVIDDGNYNFLFGHPNFICDEIILKMNAASPNGYIYNCTYDTLTNKITLSSTGAFSLLWGTGTGDRSRFISYLMGYGVYNLASDVGPSTSITSPSTGNLGGPAGLLVTINRIFDRNIARSSNGKTGTFFVPVNSSSGTTSFYYNVSNTASRLKTGFNSGQGTAYQLEISIDTQEMYPYYPLNTVLSDWKMVLIVKERI